jgi:hypothetical protein
MGRAGTTYPGIEQAGCCVARGERRGTFRPLPMRRKVQQHQKPSTMSTQLRRPRPRTETSSSRTTGSSTASSPESVTSAPGCRPHPASSGDGLSTQGQMVGPELETKGPLAREEDVGAHSDLCQRGGRFSSTRSRQRCRRSSADHGLVQRRCPCVTPGPPLPRVRDWSHLPRGVNRTLRLAGMG